MGIEAYTGYFGIQDIGLFFFLRDIGAFFFFFDMGYSGIWDMGYWNLFWDTS